MNNSDLPIFFNRFPIKFLSEADKTVQTYNYQINPSPEPGKEYSEASKILWKLWTPAAILGNIIVTKEIISEKYLQGENYSLQHQGAQVLNPENENQLEALERIERRSLEKILKQRAEKNRIERHFTGGFIWWNADKIILQDRGWEVHTGVNVDVSVHSSGVLFLEIDTHHRFYTPWLLSQWLKTYPDIPIDWVRNTYDTQSWRYSRTSEEKAETLILAGSGMSLADYHRNHKQPATEAEIQNSYVVYVKNSKGQEIPHLSDRLKPSISMEILSDLATNKKQKEAEKVFKQCKQTNQARFDKATEVARWLCEKIYEQKDRASKLKPQKTQGILLRQTSLILLTQSIKVSRAEASLKQGCFRTGEKQFGCLDLVGNGIWSATIKNKLESTAKKSNVEIYLEKPKIKTDLPDSLLTRKQFWQDWAERGTNTVLVVSNWLQDSVKTQLRREALEANIALQFMLPMPTSDNYRAVNIVLGMLVKAKWQPIGLEALQDEQAAEIVIGFDAGTNRNLYYGTSAFAVLANGQSLGWELPEAQTGERLSGQAVLRAVINIISRFRQSEKRLPKRILLLRDGFVRVNEFEATIATLQEANIAVDLLGVRKSGAGRMAIFKQESDRLIDAPPKTGILSDALPGTAVLSEDVKTFRIVTSVAKAGGSARPLQIVRDFGDAPLQILAKQIDRLTLLHPASGYSASRLPNVLHYADKMAKEVQRLGEVAILQNVDREKIFFA